jgi:hypothetical protein
LKGVLSGEVGILSGRNTRYCDSGQSRNSVDLLPACYFLDFSRFEMNITAAGN